jgi:hypothetical protein
MAWTLKGEVVIACNCDYGCPCNFNGYPSTGKCEGGWTWHVEEGAYDGVDLAGLNFSVYANWPGAIHEGDGEAVILIDERADGEQRAAIETLVSGKVGGPWGVLGWTWPTIHGPHAVPYDVHLDGLATSVRAGETLEIQVDKIRNPVTGDEVTPAVMLPQGIIFKEGDLGTSTTFRLNDGVAYDHSGRYTAVGPFAYSG